MKKNIVFGDLGCHKSDLYNEAKKYKIDQKQIDLFAYDECKNYDAKKLINSKKMFSIIVPYYDTYETIKETLDSLANQSFDLKKVEVIIISDGAKKSIDHLVKTYQKENKFGRFELIKKQNGNWGSVINFVKQQKIINADYFTILDSDDKLEPQCLSVFAKYINEKNNVDVLTSKFYFWKSKKNQKQKRKIYYLHKSHYFNEIDEYYFKTPYSFPICKFYRTNILYNSQFQLLENCSFQDVCFFYEIKKSCHTWQYINKYLGCYRCDRNTSSSNEEWSDKKILSWKWTIEYLSKQDSGCTARFYLLANHFLKHYKNFVKNQTKSNNSKIELKKKYTISYVSKQIKLITKIFLFFVVLFNRKIIKLI